METTTEATQQAIQVGEKVATSAATSSVEVYEAGRRKSADANQFKSQLSELAVFGGVPAFAEPLHVGRPNIGNRQRRE